MTHFHSPSTGEGGKSAPLLLVPPESAFGKPCLGSKLILMKVWVTLNSVRRSCVRESVSSEQ